MELKRKSYQVADDHEISIAECGSGPAIVFLHGSGPGASASSNFRGNKQAFVDAGFRVILPDFIGYGQSSKPAGIDYTLDLFTNTMMEALRQHGIEKATLVGNSLGGGVAIKIAVEHRDFVDRLVLMSPGCIEPQEFYFTMPGIAKMKSSFGSEDFGLEDQRRLVCNLVYDDSVVTDELVAERFEVARQQPVDVLARMKTPDLTEHLSKLDMPILGYWGNEDEFLPASGAQKFLDNCDNVRFMTFNKVGHWVQLEREKEFNAYTIAFLNE